MRQEIEFYDRKGFVPSVDITTLDDYLRESEVKFKALQAFEADPHKFVADQLEIEVDFELVKASDEWAERFYRRFLTDPLPGVHTDAEGFKQLISPQMVGGKVIYTLWNKQPGLGKSGTVLKFENLQLPILKRDSHDEDKVSEIVCHETIHCVRNQHEVWSYFDVFKTRDNFEEAVAHLIGKDDEVWKRDKQFYLRIDPGCYGFIRSFVPFTTMTAIVEAMIIYSKLNGSMSEMPYWDVGIVAGVGVVAGFGGLMTYSLAQSVYGHKAAKHFARCEEEGLNAEYMFLRSDPKDFDKRRPIRDQLYQSENPRFQIMSYKMGLK